MGDPGGLRKRHRNRATWPFCGEVMQVRWNFLVMLSAVLTQWRMSKGTLRGHDCRTSRKFGLDRRVARHGACPIVGGMCRCSGTECGWNERQAPRPPINFTKQENGAAHLWHRSAEATFTRDGDAVSVLTRVGAEPERQAILAMRIAAERNVLALADDTELRTSAAAAEHVLTPLLVETLAKP